jgi:asparagine synthetase B (glutamine-hydrolysing)
MDSASVLGAAKQIARNETAAEISTYSTVDSARTNCVETKKIGELARVVSDRHHTVDIAGWASSPICRAYLERRVQHTHPASTPLVALELSLARAHQDEHTVVLNGGAGDCCSETNNSYLWHYARRFGLAATWSEARAASTNHTYLKGRAALPLFLSAAIRGRVPEWVRRVRRHSLGHEQGQHTLLGDINESYAKRIGLVERVAAENGAIAVRRRENFLAERHDYMFPVEIRHGLEAYDRCAGHFGIEMSDPYSDRRVVEFFLQLPVEWLTHNGWTKYLVRSSFSQDLPNAVVWSNDKSHVSGYLKERLLAFELECMREIGAPALECAREFLSEARYEELRGLMLGKLEPGRLRGDLVWRFGCEWLPTFRWLLRLRGRSVGAL